MILVTRWWCFAIAFSPFSSPKEFASIVEFSFSNRTLGEIIPLEVLLIPSMIMSIVVHRRQRSGTRRALMSILQKKLMMFFCLRQCMNKLGIVLEIVCAVLLVQYPVLRKHCG